MLTDDQKDTVRLWAEAGDSLSEIHRKIGDELKITMTYLDARMLVSELEVSLNKPEPPEEEEEADAETDEEIVEADAAGGVDVSVDAVTQPQAMVSGKVTFSDGGRAAWYVDQMGRLGLDSEVEGYQPSEDDVMAFQMKLQEVLKAQGF